MLLTTRRRDIRRDERKREHGKESVEKGELLPLMLLA
jgi:hypothetical protein